MRKKNSKFYSQNDVNPNLVKINPKANVLTKSVKLLIVMSLPKTWEPMPRNQAGFEVTVQAVNLAPTSVEYRLWRLHFTRLWEIILYRASNESKIRICTNRTSLESRKWTKITAEIMSGYCSMVQVLTMSPRSTHKDSTEVSQELLAVCRQRRS